MVTFLETTLTYFILRLWKTKTTLSFVSVAIYPYLLYSISMWVRFGPNYRNLQSCLLNCISWLFIYSVPSTVLCAEGRTVTKPDTLLLPWNLYSNSEWRTLNTKTPARDKNPDRCSGGNNWRGKFLQMAQAPCGGEGHELGCERHSEISSSKETDRTHLGHIQKWILFHKKQQGLHDTVESRSHTCTCCFPRTVVIL